MSEWIKHVKKYQEKFNCSYKDALKGAKHTYKKQRGSGALLSRIKDEDMNPEQLNKKLKKINTKKEYTNTDWKKSDHLKLLKETYPNRRAAVVRAQVDEYLPPDLANIVYGYDI